jgi:serine/threonine-protein kinase
MGTVYLARDPDLPRSDALKVLAPGLSHDPDFRRRFAREAEVAAGLDHPNIVAIRRRGEFDGQLWIAMQFVDGPDADEALRSGAMTPTRALRIVTEVAEALDYAHQHNVVHRDVKPANFLLSHTATARERVLLGDFGIARALDNTQLTGAAGPTASVAYAAPEVLAGFAFDGRADVYSLGCALFRMLTAKTPFSTANGMMAVMMAHLQAPPPKVTDLMPGLPTQLDDVIATAMAKAPAQRFGTARQLAAAAAEAVAHTAPQAMRPVPGAAVNPYTGPPRPAAPPTWHHGDPRTPPGTIATPNRAPLQWAAPAARASRRKRVAAVVAAAAVAAAAAVTAVSLLRGSGTDTPSSTATTATAGTMATTPVPTSTPAKVAAIGLDRLLLSATEISAILVSDPMFDEPVHASLSTTPRQCPTAPASGCFCPHKERPTPAADGRPPRPRYSAPPEPNHGKKESSRPSLNSRQPSGRRNPWPTKATRSKSAQTVRSPAPRSAAPSNTGLSANPSSSTAPGASASPLKAPA